MSPLSLCSVCLRKVGLPPSAGNTTPPAAASQRVKPPVRLRTCRGRRAVARDAVFRRGQGHLGLWSERRSNPQTHENPCKRLHTSLVKASANQSVCRDFLCVTHLPPEHEVTGSNPVGRVDESPASCGVSRFYGRDTPGAPLFSPPGQMEGRNSPGSAAAPKPARAWPTALSKAAPCSWRWRMR
jgi:hypothetical protein